MCDGPLKLPNGTLIWVDDQDGQARVEAPTPTDPTLVFAAAEEDALAYQDMILGQIAAPDAEDVVDPVWNARTAQAITRWLLARRSA